MARLVIAVIILASGALAVFAVTAGARRLMSSGARGANGIGRGAFSLKQMSFVLLVALIFYAAIWGAG